MSFELGVSTAPWPAITSWQDQPPEVKLEFTWFDWAGGYNGINYYLDEFPGYFLKIESALPAELKKACRKLHFEFFPDDEERWFPVDFSKPITADSETKAYFTSPKTLSEFLPYFEKIDYELLFKKYDELISGNTAEWQCEILKQWYNVCQHCVENDLGLRIVVA